MAEGDLTIGASTTVGEFSEAVLSNNPDWERGDQLTFFYGVQIIDAVSGVPRAKISGTKVKMDPNDETPLWNITGDMGFKTVDGFLGMAQVITDGAAAWVHSREEDGASTLMISTQYMFVDSTVLATYQGDAAFETSANSYGGINTKAVYLQPDEKTNLQCTGIYSSEAEGQSSGGGGESGGSGGQTGGQTGGGDTGGGQSGGQNGGGDTGGGSDTGGGQSGGQNGGSGGGDDDENT